MNEIIFLKTIIWVLHDAITNVKWVWSIEYFDRLIEFSVQLDDKRNILMYSDKVEHRQIKFDLKSVWKINWFLKDACLNHKEKFKTII